jgi:uncharacterized repeat protein (TIGR03843 family)
MALGPSFDVEAVEERLRTLPEVELLGLLRQSSNYTFLARLCGEPGLADGGLADIAGRGDDGMLAVYKPVRGERPLWDFPHGTLYAREVAAYRLAKALGWPRIPPTVVREEAPHGRGALQLFVPVRDDSHYLAVERSDVDAERWMEVAAFDVIVNNADRKAGHCLIDDGGEVWVIDHGLTFHVEHKLRTVIWDFAGRRLPARLRRDVARVVGALDGDAGDDGIGTLLAEDELAMLRRRLRAVANPGWRYPNPSSSWAVPWPPV